MSEKPIYINLTEAAKLIGTKFSKKPMYPQLLRHYILFGSGPKFKKIGKHYFFHPSDVLAWEKPKDGRVDNGRRKYQDW